MHPLEGAWDDWVSSRDEPSLAEIRELLDEHPEVARTKVWGDDEDDRKAYPLAWAIRYSYPPDVMRFLFVKYPDAMLEKDGYGKWPFHELLTCDDETLTANIVRVMLIALPEIADQKDEQGRTALQALEFLESSKGERVGCPEVPDVARWMRKALRTRVSEGPPPKKGR